MACSGKDCYICKQSRWFRKLKRDARHGSRRAAVRAVSEVFNNLICAEADNDYYQCILAGTWPTAVEQLEYALEKAKKFRLEHPDN